MTVSINQEDNFGYSQVLDYAELYVVDTVVIIWRATNQEQRLWSMTLSRRT